MSKDLTVKEIKEELDALGIGYEANMKKAELLEILESETVKSVEEKPKKYIVIHDFKDLEDGSYVYFKGKPFPRKGVKVDEDRIEELSSENNKQGKPLIKEQD